MREFTFRRRGLGSLEKKRGKDTSLFYSQDTPSTAALFFLSFRLKAELSFAMMRPLCVYEPHRRSVSVPSGPVLSYNLGCCFMMSVVDRLLVERTDQAVNTLTTAAKRLYHERNSQAVCLCGGHSSIHPLPARHIKGPLKLER